MLINTTNRCLMALSILLILALSNLVSATRTNLLNNAESELTIEALCANKPVKLTRISQVLDLIESLRRQRSQLKSCEAYKNSILSLEELLVTVQTGSDGPYGELKSVPKALRRFFIGLAFQIDAACKINLINNFENDIKGRLSVEDYETIGYIEESHAAFLDDSEKIRDFDDVVRLKDIGGEDGNNDAKMLIKMKSDMFVKKLQETCLNKFKPIYSKLILPLVELSNLGYNYQGELLSRELEELRRNKFVKRWYNIVQTCESYEAIELYYDTSQRVYRNNQVITFISRQEADILASRNMRIIPKLRKEGLINYEPDISHNSDELWILQQGEEIENLISKYKATVTEGTRIRGRLMRRLYECVKTALKGGNFFKFIASRFKKDDSPSVIDDTSSIITITKSGEIGDNHMRMIGEVIRDEEAKVGDVDELPIVSKSISAPKAQQTTSSSVIAMVDGETADQHKLNETIAQLWVCGLAGLMAISQVGV